LEGALKSCGYNAKAIENPSVKSFQLGKEYGNNGQCNPTYFTVGSLVEYLINMENSGIPKNDILNNYIFITAGACGPCRFGMYEAEYRLALRNSGFDGFRVMLFQQSGGLNQSGEEEGLEMNADFFLSLLNGMNVGDLFHEIGFRIRPFETTSGETDRILNDSIERMSEIMSSHSKYRFSERTDRMLSAFPKVKSIVLELSRFVDQLRTDHYTSGLRHARDQFNQIELDRLQVKPMVKITGEFWAQTTEGDGNFNMFKFLEREGAEVLVEPIATWINYMIHHGRTKIRHRLGIREGNQAAGKFDILKKLKNLKDDFQMIGLLNIAEYVFNREFERFRKAIGGIPHKQIDQSILEGLGGEFYNQLADGGEGHLEVAKNIYYTEHNLCHMVLSVKPFGCMPSTQSDGIQSAVTAKYSKMIFLPIETSGEGEINAHSRVQMALGEARVKAKEEFARILESTGRSLDEIRDYIDEHPELKKPMYLLPKDPEVVGTAANLVLHVNDLISQS